MRTINLKDNNPFYAPAGDDCWVVLAQEIMNCYALRYMYQIPMNAYTQEEYDMLDRKNYAPQRRSILKCIKNGPLRNIVDIHAIYCGLEQRRLEHKRKMNINWIDNYKEDIDTL